MIPCCHFMEIEPPQSQNAQPSFRPTVLLYVLWICWYCMQLRWCSGRLVVGHKLRLNSVPPTPLQLVWHTGKYLCVSKEACGVCMCWRMIFFTMHLWANQNVCELCERYICRGVKYYFAIFPPSPPFCLSSSLTLTLLHSVFLLYGSKKWSWWFIFQPVEHQKRILTEWFWILSSFLSLFFLSVRILISFSHHSLPESWCRCWRGIWMCPAEANIVSPSSEPSKPSSTSSSSSSAHACSTPSECLCTFVSVDWSLC